MLETAQVRQLTNGPESFTPDGNWILGQSAEVCIAQVRQLTNGPESFTPDGNWILGQSAEVCIYTLGNKLSSS